METLQGVDIDIEISLKEYGLAWVERENDYHFYFGTKYSDITDGISEDGYSMFDWGDIFKDIDMIKEYDWVEWDSVYSLSGLDKEEFHSMDIPSQIHTLLQYYGYLNVFGESYCEGLTYDEVIKDKKTD